MQSDPDLITVARIARTFRTDPLPWLLNMTPEQMEVLVAAHNAVAADERRQADAARDRLRELTERKHNPGKWSG
jgi:hypothetical protein